MTLGRADAIIEFIETACFVNYMGDIRPMRLMEHQKKLIRKVFGNEKKKPGKRYKLPPLIVRLIVSWAKKNGKTELIAALILCFLCGPEAFYGLEILSVAGGSKEQANELYECVAGFIERNPKLTPLFKVLKFSIKHKTLKTRYRFWGTREKSIRGVKPFIWIYDEMSASADIGLFTALQKSQAQYHGHGMGMIISTNAPTDNTFSDLIENVLNKQKDGGMKEWHIVICEGGLEGDIFSRENILKANPSANPLHKDDIAFLSIDELLRDAELAKGDPKLEKEFIAYTLNRGTQSLAAFVNIEEWQRRAMPMTLEQLRGQRCWGGLDLSQTTDLTGFALYFPDDCYVWATAWIPTDDLKRRSQTDIRADYERWIKEGHIHGCYGIGEDGNKVINLEQVAREIERISTIVNIEHVHYDRWQYALMQAAASYAVPRITLPEMEPMGQGYQSYTPALAEFDRAFKGGHLHHCDNPALNMCVRNLGVDIAPNSTTLTRKPAKLHRSGRIDMAVAMLMAMAKPTIPEEKATADSLAMNWDRALET